jgi:hypothetical protein
MHADRGTLELAHQLGMPWTGTLLRSVAAAAKLPLLQWLHLEQQCAFPRDITYSAAQGGSVKMLQWLAGQDCQFYAKTSYYAALAGRMHVLQFLSDVGCRFDKDCVDAQSALPL